MTDAREAKAVSQACIFEKPHKLWSGYGRAEKVALHLVAAVLFEKGELSFGLNSFSYNTDSQVVRHGYNRQSYSGVVFIFGDIFDKRAVNFQSVQRQPPELT
jgi:hypothetical protein